MRVRTTVLLLTIAATAALVRNVAAPRSHVHVRRRAKLMQTMQEGKDFSGAAIGLFNNMRTPASLLAGTAGGLAYGFVPSATCTGALALFKRVHTVLGVSAVCMALFTVLLCTICINKLSEEDVPPAVSVDALLQRDWEFEWVGANVNFIGGLLIVAMMIGVKAYLVLGGGSFGSAAALIVASIFAGSLHIVNAAIAEGDGTSAGGVQFGASMTSLVTRYLELGCKKLTRGNGLFGWLAIASGALAAVVLGGGVVTEGAPLILAALK